LAATTDSPGPFLAAVGEHRPQVAIVDVRMPPTHTDEVTAVLRYLEDGQRLP
jgi:hypothetical protein